MSRINTNMAALTATQQRNSASQRLETALERLGSGLRINSAKDDAAGLAIANRMSANLRANNKVHQGVNDGVSLIQTAEGGLDSINTILHRARELAAQAANDTLSDQDRRSINLEYQSLRDEIDRTVLSTEAFGKYPLAPETPLAPAEKLGNTQHIIDKLSPNQRSYSSGIVSVAYIPSGATNVVIDIDSLSADDDIQVFTRDGVHLVGTPIIGSPDNPTDTVWQSRGITDAASAESQLLTEANGFNSGATYDSSAFADGSNSYDTVNPPATASYNGMTITYSGDRERQAASETGDDPATINDGTVNGQTLERVTIDTTTEPLVLMVVGSGAFYASSTWDDMPVNYETPDAPIGTATDVITRASSGEKAEKVTIEPTPADHVSLGLDGVALEPRDKALEAIAKLDGAFSKINDYRSQYGALQNRFESVLDSVATDTQSLKAARSRIMDADYAVESANLLRQQIIQNAGSTMLAQANQTPQSILNLLGS